MQTELAALQVLIVEDSEFQRMMLEQALRGLGVQKIVAAANGAEAMRVLRTLPSLDLVIMDVVMPEVDGIELIPLLRDAAVQAPLIFVSSEEWALGIATEIARSRGLPVLATIHKPVTPQKLRQVLDARVASGAQ